MTSESSNDNAGSGAGDEGPDAHGQAALLLVESLVHGLIARQVISVADAVEIVDIAAEVKAEVAAEGEDPSAAKRQSADLLDAISRSLGHDVQGG